MKISTRGRYSTRLLLELALNYGKGPTLLKEISKAQDISQKYLNQLIMPLKVAGLVLSTRGAHGGYLLAKQPEDIKLSDIIIAVEGPVNLVECVNNPGICPRYEDCVSREAWEEVSVKCLEVLQSYTLKDLVDRQYEKQGK
ncbi:MAG: RrF2 family transcriptional regulator [Actinomycetota bacterium]